MLCLSLKLGVKEYCHYIFCVQFSDVCLQSRRSTAQSTVQATCAAGLPVSWALRGRARQTSKIALTSAAWWRWDASTRTRLSRLTGKSRLNPQSSSRDMPWMANSPLLIKGKIEFQPGCRGLFFVGA